MKRLLAIGFIWFMCSVAWMVLGGTLVARSGETDWSLKEEVQALWGPPQVQQPPSATYVEEIPVKDVVTEFDARGQQVRRVHETVREESRPVPLVGSDLEVALNLEHRRKGLLWYPTYEVHFQGTYAFENPSPAAQTVTVRFPLQSESRVFDGFAVFDDAGEAVPAAVEAGQASWSLAMEPQATRRVRVAYTSRGIATWTYGPSGLSGDDLRVRDFRLALTTDFAEVDFPPGSLSPNVHGPKDGGWQGEWAFESLVSSAGIGLTLPQRLNPGPLASGITFFAPISLLFFFFVVAVLAVARQRTLHPMNYFFLGAAFFAFHLLFAYLVDHLHVAAAFGIASATSLFLVVSYARLFTGWRFALREMALAQLVYLVLFSYTFFLEGFTGLAITLGAVVTLFLTMQITGRLDWGQAVPAVRPDPPAPVEGQAT